MINRSQFAIRMGNAIRSVTEAITAAILKSQGNGQATDSEAEPNLRLVERHLDTSSLVDQFLGDSGQTADEWLRQLKSVKKVGKCTPDVTWSVILNKMAGPAKVWHRNHGAGLETFEEWARAYTGFFFGGVQANFVEQ